MMNNLYSKNNREVENEGLVTNIRSGVNERTISNEGQKYRGKVEDENKEYKDDVFSIDEILNKDG